MSKSLNVRVNLSKILKDRIYEGKTGKFVDLTVYVNDEADQYGNDCSVILQQTKEDRDSKTRHYIGNGKTVDRIVAERKQAEAVSVEDDGLDF